MRRNYNTCFLIPIGSFRKHCYTCLFNQHSSKTRRRRIGARTQKRRDVKMLPRRSIAVHVCHPILKVRQLELCLKRFSDRISELRDDILVHILSLLPMKEAGRTSVLSKRWIHVWAHVPVLNFDAGKIDYESMMLEDDYIDMEKFEVEEARYVNWVDQVVSSHKAPTIDVFRIVFNLEDYSGEYIDYWIKSALKKRVKKLELNFEGFLPEAKNKPYYLPANALSSYNSLTSLQLAYLDVNDEALEIIVSNCRALELLSVKDSALLLDLKIVGQSLNLKFLIIDRCTEMTNLEISAPKLTSLSYFGPKLCFNLKSAPNLSKLSVRSRHDFFIFSSSVSHQIEELTLEIPSYIKVMEGFPICKKLKMLDLTYDPYLQEDLFLFGSLIKACPLLHKFVFRLNLDVVDEIDTKERARKTEACPHEHLKILEVIGCGIDIEFVNYLLEIAVSLEKIIIDPYHPIDKKKLKYIGTTWEYTTSKMVRRARKVANQLNTHLKPGIDLEIR